MYFTKAVLNNDSLTLASFETLIISNKTAAEGLIAEIFELITPPIEGVVPTAKESQELAVKGFGIPYSNTGHSLEVYQKHVGNIKSLFNANPLKYHSLYSAVVQSSGYGKSRTLLRAAKNLVHTLYLCLREPTSSGYPIGNQDMKQKITNYCKSVQRAKLFLALVYIMAYEHIVQCHNDTFDGQELPLNLLELPAVKAEEGVAKEDLGYAKFNEFWGKVIELMEGFEKMTESEGLQAKSELFTRIERLQQGYKTFYSGNPNRIQETGTYYDINGSPHPSEIVLVFDEAKCLLDGEKSQSYFRCLRSAHKLLEFRDFVLIFVDTVSTISNFSPPFSHDPSARPTRTFDLLPAFYHITTYNSCVLAAEQESRVHGLAELFSRGRPLWGALYFNKKMSLSLETIHMALEYAKRKLSNMSVPNIETCYFGALACLSIRFGIWGVLDHSYASALLSSYMATALHFGDDRIRMFVYYVPEPILSEAACQLIYCRNGISNCPAGMEYGATLNQVFEKFESAIISGFLDAGSIGELVGRIVLSLAYDYIHVDCIQHRMQSGDVDILFSDPISLREFIDILVPKPYRDRYEKLFGVDCFDVNHDSCRVLLDSGEIAFTTFEIVDSNSQLEITQRFLANAFAHRFAYIGSKNQAGCDLIIPIRYTRNNQIQYSALIVQVKNHEGGRSGQGGRFSDAGLKLTPQYCSSRQDVADCYMGLYFELNFEQYQVKVKSATKKRAITHHGTYGNHIVLLDLNATEFIGSDLKGRLASLRLRHVDQVGRLKDKDLLKLMAPHRFS